jgi:hypothetical protein
VEAVEAVEVWSIIDIRFLSLYLTLGSQAVVPVVLQGVLLGVVAVERHRELLADALPERLWRHTTDLRSGFLAMISSMPLLFGWDNLISFLSTCPADIIDQIVIF